MKLIMSFLEKYLMPLSDKVTSNKLLNAIKDACILTSPFTVVGSLAGLVSQQANYWFGEWGIPLDGILGSIINAFANINTVAMGMTGLVVVLASSYNYSNQLRANKTGDKCVPLLILKKDNEIELANSVYTNKFAIFLPCSESKNKEGYRFPIFVYHDVDVLANLYYYDYNAFRSQIDNAEINEVTSGALLECVLIMINVYDRNSDSHFLVLAEYLLQLLEPFITEELILLNRLQIKKRTGEFNKDDLDLLNKIDSDEIHILFGKYVLLGNKIKAQKYFEQFSEEDQSRYKGFPIYKLYGQL